MLQYFDLLIQMFAGCLRELKLRLVEGEVYTVVNKLAIV
jgi:hypothetical protein